MMVKQLSSYRPWVKTKGGITGAVKMHQFCYGFTGGGREEGGQKTTSQNNPTYYANNVQLSPKQKSRLPIIVAVGQNFTPRLLCVHNE